MFSIVERDHTNEGFLIFLSFKKGTQFFVKLYTIWLIENDEIFEQKSVFHTMDKVGLQKHLLFLPSTEPA